MAFSHSERNVIPTKDFDSWQETRHAGVAPDSLKFKLGGQTLERLVSFSPYILAEFQDEGNPTMQTTIDSIRDMLHPRSHAKFEKALKEGKPAPTMDTLMELISWLVEQATGRPTSPPLPSSAGPNGTGTPSTDGSASVRALTSAESV